MKFIKAMPWSARIGFLGVFIFLFSAVFADLIAPYGERDIVGDVWEPSSGKFLLGTDNLGRDLLSRMMYGAQTTIFISAVASVLSFSVGIFLSFLAAVVRGWTDQVLSRLNDMMMAIPTLIFALVVLAALPQELWILVLVMALIDSTRVFRLGRAVAVDIVVMDYVRGGAPARRGADVDHFPGDPAQRALASLGRIRTAFRFRCAFPLVAFLPRSGDPAAGGGLGRHGEGQQGRHHLRRSRRADSRWRHRGTGDLR